MDGMLFACKVGMKDYRGFEITKLGEKTGWWAIYAMGSFKTTKLAKKAIDEWWEDVHGKPETKVAQDDEPTHRRIDLEDD